MRTEIKNKTDLDKRLQELELQRAALEKRISKKSQETFEILTNPSQIIKRTVSDLAGDTNFRTDLLHLVIAGAATYAGKKIAAVPFISRLLTVIRERFFEKGGQENNTTANAEQNENDSSSTLLDDLLQAFLKKRDQKN